jgi:hypothetical protein
MDAIMESKMEEQEGFDIGEKEDNRDVVKLGKDFVNNMGSLLTGFMSKRK